MKFPAWIHKVFLQYGQPVETRKDGGIYSFYACIMPYRFQAHDGNSSHFTRFGQVDTRLFHYYGPPDAGGEMLSQGDLLKAGGQYYEVLSIYDFGIGETAAYRRAVLQMQPEVDTDESF